MEAPARWLMLRELVKRDLQARYAGSALGFVWSFVQPLWQLMLFTFVFGHVMKVSPLGERAPSFPLFLFSGLLPWLAIQEGLTRAANAITDQAHLVKKLRFPSELLVVSVTAAALVHEAIAALVFGLLLALVGALSWSSLPWLLAVLPLQIGITLGLGLLLAAANVFLRDVAQVLGLVLSAWFYLTPIVYPLSYVPEKFRGWIVANPLAALVGLYRRALFGGSGPVAGVLVLALFSAVVSVVGWWVFRRARPAFADLV